MIQLFEEATGVDVFQSKVRFLGRGIQLGISPDILGRVFDGLGRPIDNGPKLLPEKKLDINGNPINPTLNGIDYLEVASVDQKTLEVYFLHNLPGETNPVPLASPPDVLTESNILIEGGVRIKNIRVKTVTPKDTAHSADVQRVHVATLTPNTSMRAATRSVKCAVGKTADWYN